MRVKDVLSLKILFVFLILLKLSVLPAQTLDSLRVIYKDESPRKTLAYLHTIDTSTFTKDQMIDYYILAANIYRYSDNHRKALQYYNYLSGLTDTSAKRIAKRDLLGVQLYDHFEEVEKTQELMQKVDKYLESHKPDSTFIAKYYLSKINFYTTKAEFEKAMKFATEVMPFVEQSATPGVKASFYISVGELLRKNQKLNRAGEYYKMAEKIALEHKLKLHLAKVYNNQSIILKERGDTLQALNKFKKSAALYEIHRGESTAAPAYYNIGLQYTEMGNFVEGFQYFRRVLDIGQKYDFDKAIYFGHLGFGISYGKQGLIDDAEFHFKKALDLAKKQGLAPAIGRTYELLYQCYNSNNMPEKALKYYKLDQQLRDSINLAENQAKVESLEAQYQLVKKEKENKALRLKQARQKLSFFAGGGIILILILLLILMYVTSRNRKQQNALLAFQKDQINAKNKKLEEMNLKTSEQKAQLQELNEVKDEMFRIISHDLRSPLSSVYMLMQMLDKDHIDRNKAMEMSRQLSFEVNQAIFLLNNLLVWAHLNTDTVNPVFTELPLKNIIKEVIENFATEIERKQLVIKEQIPDDTIVKVDEHMVSTIVSNLVSNAIKFSNSNGEIIFRISIGEDKTELTITDQGVGFPAHEKKHIFEPGVRLEKGTEGERGSGLGLTISKKYAELLGGKLSITSHENETIALLELKQSEVG